MHLLCLHLVSHLAVQIHCCPHFCLHVCPHTNSFSHFCLQVCPHTNSFSHFLGQTLCNRVYKVLSLKIFSFKDHSPQNSCSSLLSTYDHTPVQLCTSLYTLSVSDLSTAGDTSPALCDHMPDQQKQGFGRVLLLHLLDISFSACGHIQELSSQQNDHSSSSSLHIHHCTSFCI